MQNAGNYHAADALLETLNECRASLATDDAIKLGDVLARLQQAGFALTGVILSLPFLLPIPLGPFSIPVGLTFVAFGVQIINGRSVMWVPRRVLNKSLHGRIWRGVLGLARRIALIARRISRPRLMLLVRPRAGRLLAGMLFIGNGLLLAAPLVFMPFGNTIPAIGVLLTCLAVLMDDGVFMLLAILWLGSLIGVVLALLGVLLVVLF